MQKGKKDTLQAHAAAHGESANSVINRAIDQAIALDSAGDQAHWGADSTHKRREHTHEMAQELHQQGEGARRVGDQNKQEVYTMTFLSIAKSRLKNLLLIFEREAGIIGLPAPWAVCGRGDD